jgi:cyclopropane fatty-acyl-phospholipid synthase-like methyltransferase
MGLGMQSSYDHIADEWHSNGRDQSYVDRVLGYVDLVLKDLQRGARVLDLGCGTGVPIAKHVIQRGFHVVAVDESQKMLEIAKKEVPEAELIHDNMVNVQLTGRFAAAIAWDSLFHVERKYHSSIFNKLARSLEDGGKLLLSVGGSGADSFRSEMFGHTFFYSGHEPEVTRKLLEDAGFEIELWEVDDPSSRGHIAVIARRVFQAE